MPRILIAMVLLAAPLCAQGTTPPPATADKESFLVQPKNVSAGSKDLALRFVANTSGGFTTSSSKPPQVKFSAGATLKPGSFAMLNANEAECKVDIADDAVGTIDVTIELYSVNGTKTLQTLRGTMGIAGATGVPNSQAKVGAESVELVRVNVAEAQRAGAILITGKVNGTVSITAPTGTLFTRAPTATATGASIGAPQLSATNTVFSFTIGNAALADASVRVSDITLSTQLFGVGGGVEGQLACEVTGTALGGQTALVVVAHTAKTTVQGENDIAGDQPVSTPKPDAAPAPQDNNTLPPANSNSGWNDTSGMDERNRERERQREAERQNRNNQQNPGSSPGSYSPAQGPQNSNDRGPQPRPQNPQMPQQGEQIQSVPQPAPPGSAPIVRGKDAAGSPAAGTPVGDGSARPAEGDVPASQPGHGGPLKGEPGTAPLPVSPGLHFCDKDFKPLGAVVLDKAVGDEAGGRVWILLRRPQDKDPEKVETVTVKLTVSGATRELILTETGKNTGEFRCGKEGVLLIAAENPDSNKEEAAPEPPKARTRY